jgi:hypothetical protein
MTGVAKLLKQEPVEGTRHSNRQNSCEIPVETGISEKCHLSVESRLLTPDAIRFP